MQSNILPVALLLLLKLNSDADVKFFDTKKIRKSEHPKACIPCPPWLPVLLVWIFTADQHQPPARATWSNTELPTKPAVHGLTVTPCFISARLTRASKGLENEIFTAGTFSVERKLS